jgi:hypothetical protein
VRGLSGRGRLGARPEERRLANTIAGRRLTLLPDGSAHKRPRAHFQFLRTGHPGGWRFNLLLVSADYLALGIILASALYLFWTQKLRTDVTALLVMLALITP